MTATIVRLGLTLAGDVSSFNEAARTRLAAALREALECHQPECSLEIELSSASVHVDAALTMPDVAVSPSTVSAVTNAANTLVASSPSQLSRQLAVTVLAATPVTVATGVPVAMAVAPPPSAVRGAEEAFPVATVAGGAAAAVLALALCVYCWRCSAGSGSNGSCAWVKVTSHIHPKAPMVAA